MCLPVWQTAQLFALLQLPIGSEAEFEGVFDLVAMKAITWKGEVPCFVGWPRN